MHKIIRKTLLEFSKQNITYVILRPDGADVDISMPKEDYERAVTILRKNGFIKHIQNFNETHRAFRHKGTGIDIQLDGVNWNGIYYLKSEIYANKIKKNRLWYLHPIDELIMYVCHSILGKRYFKPQYFKNITNSKIAFDYINPMLKEIFGKPISIKKDMPFKSLCFSAIIRHPFPFIKTAINWLKWKMKPRPMISFIGTDGCGKSTTVQNLAKELKQYGYDCEIVYFGRGRDQVIKSYKIGNKIKHKYWFFYWVGFIFWWIDLMIRYYTKIKPLRKNKIVITDRCAYDLLQVKKVPMFLKEFAVSFFPTPNYTFLQHRDYSKILKSRDMPFKEYIRQLNIMVEIPNIIFIQAENEKQTLSDILRTLF